MRRIFALLDSPFLTRVGNLRTLLGVAVLGVGIVIGAVLAVLSVGPWWPVVAAAVTWLTVLLVVHASWRRHDIASPVGALERLPLAGRLETEIAAGEVLLREARQPNKLATPWKVDDMRRRGTEWASRVSAALAEQDEDERLNDWTHVSVWTAGRPIREDGSDVKACIEDRLRQRVGVVERYVREIANGEPSTPTRWE